MKKVFLLVAVISALTFASCTKCANSTSTGKDSVTTVDTVSVDTVAVDTTVVK